MMVNTWVITMVNDGWWWITRAMYHVLLLYISSCTICLHIQLYIMFELFPHSFNTDNKWRLVRVLQRWQPGRSHWPPGTCKLWFLAVFSWAPSPNKVNKCPKFSVNPKNSQWIQAVPRVAAWPRYRRWSRLDASYPMSPKCKCASQPAEDTNRAAASAAVEVPRCKTQITSWSQQGKFYRGRYGLRYGLLWINI